MRVKQSAEFANKTPKRGYPIVSEETATGKKERERLEKSRTDLPYYRFVKALNEAR